MSWALIRDRDLLLAEAEQVAEQAATLGWKSWSWTSLRPGRKHPKASRIRFSNSPNPCAPTPGSEAFRAEARAFVQKTIADLPPDGRDFAGKDEAALELFLDRVLASGADLVTARLKAGGSQ